MASGSSTGPPSGGPRPNAPACSEDDMGYLNLTTTVHALREAVLEKLKNSIRLGREAALGSARCRARRCRLRLSFWRLHDGCHDQACQGEANRAVCNRARTKLPGKPYQFQYGTQITHATQKSCRSRHAYPAQISRFSGKLRN